MIKSKIILKLENNFSEGLVNSIKKRGTPLIEPIDNDSENILLTFLYFGTDNTKNVTIIGEFPGENYKDNYLDRIEKTNIFYKSYLVPNSLKFTYMFSENDGFNDDWKNREENLELDSNCKLKHRIDGEDFSLCSLPKSKELISENFLKRYKLNNLNKEFIKSKYLQEERKIWLITPKNPKKLIIFFDGNDYLENLYGEEIVNHYNFKNNNELLAVFIENKNRFKDFDINENYSNFILKEVLKELEKKYNFEEKIICGLSLGCRGILNLLTKDKNSFNHIILQSGSYLRNYKKYDPFQIINSFNQITFLDCQFYFNYGYLEKNFYLYEKMSLYELNQNLIKSLKSKKVEVMDLEFMGGHDYIFWHEGLIEILNKISKN